MTEAVVINGLLSDPALLRDYEWYELPPRIPEEEVISSRGACARTQFDGFTDQHPENNPRKRYAKKLCATCPVQAECRKVLDHLLDHAPDPRWVTGVWAGEGPADWNRRRNGR